ncbi:MAG: hypothetical protein VB035_10095 [Candidatus Fimivivens sp.]|nr:hypothetical protein [Candidatus Fimivivens sp.]
MLTKTKVIKAVNTLLVQPYPNYTVYLNREPSNFERPSFLIMAPRYTPRTANLAVLKETVYITITCFAEVDGHGSSDSDRLSALQEGVLALFRSGYIVVEDRAVKVEASDGGQDFDRAWVDVTCVYHEVRDPNPVQLPLIQSVETTIKEES